jgi:hypothetical protein
MMFIDGDGTFCPASSIQHRFANSICFSSTRRFEVKLRYLSYYYVIQYFLSFAPIRLAACQKRIKARRMIMVFQVAKLMHDDVLDAMNGRFYQV